MSDTKKVLVRFDPSNPDQQSSDFLVPATVDAGLRLVGTRSHKVASYGMVVLTSRAVTSNDLFAKMVDSGLKILDVDTALSLLSRFVESLSNLRIGNIVELVPKEGDFEVIVIAKSPTAFGSKLP
jgi:hypothetical protein